MTSNVTVEPRILVPPQRWPGLGLGEFWRYRSICTVLARRSIKVKYRQTAVGVAWALFQPLMLMVLFSVFFGLFGRIPTEGLPYAPFHIIGLIGWYIVARILFEGATSIVANSAIVNRVYFPRAYFPSAIALASILDTALCFVAMEVTLLVFRILPGPAVIAFPFFTAIAFATGLGAALWLSALNAAYRDVSVVLPFIGQFWFFSSPIIYPTTIVPQPWLTLYYFNPLVLVIDGFRWSFAGTFVPPLEEWIIGTAVAVALFVSGYVFFRHREPGFADVV